MAIIKVNPMPGKSTLLNALLKERRYCPILPELRDTIEEVLHIKGHAFRLMKYSWPT